MDKLPDLKGPVVIGFRADGDGREGDVPDGIRSLVDEGDDGTVLPVVEHGHLQELDDDSSHDCSIYLRLGILGHFRLWMGIVGKGKSG